MEKNVENLRKVMETDVSSINSPCREAAKTWGWMRLLANCHPLHREGYARKLIYFLEKKKIKAEDLTEREISKAT
jgi:hypothetical protein